MFELVLRSFKKVAFLSQVLGFQTKAQAPLLHMNPEWFLSSGGTKEVLVSREDSAIFRIQPKDDTFGIGFDPFENAPEFLAYHKSNSNKSKSKAKSSLGSSTGSLFQPNKGKLADGFGLGALEGLDHSKSSRNRLLLDRMKDS